MFRKRCQDVAMTNIRKILLAVAGIVVLAVAWYLISPLFLDTVVDEAFPPLVVPVTATAPATAPTTTAGATSSTETPPGEVSTTTTTVPVAAEPVLVLSGAFQDADDSHKGSGSASIYEINGRNVLRFEDFDVTNGPDLHVYLVENADADSLSGFGGYIDLGELKGNQGNQNYDLPNTFDPALTGGIVIWCEPFQVLFAVAPLTGR
jgi:hypothetical protein